MKSPYVERRRVANAYLVRERDRRRWRELGLVLLVVLPLGLTLFGYTWIHLQVLHTGYRIEDAERVLDRLLQRERQLRLEASTLSSLPRVERRAREELGMRGPRLEQMVFLEEVR